MDQTTLIILVGGIIFLSSIVLSVIFLFTRNTKGKGDACSKSESDDNNGSSYEYDEDLECVATVCNTGYELSGGVCVVETTSTPASTPASTGYQGTCLINQVQTGDGTCVDFWTKDAYTITGDISGVKDFDKLPGYVLETDETSNLYNCTGTTRSRPTGIVSLGECKDVCDSDIGCGGFTFTYQDDQTTLDTYNCQPYDFVNFGSEASTSTDVFKQCYKSNVSDQIYVSNTVISANIWEGATASQYVIKTTKVYTYPITSFVNAIVPTTNTYLLIFEVGSNDNPLIAYPARSDEADSFDDFDPTHNGTYADWPAWIAGYEGRTPEQSFVAFVFEEVYEDVYVIRTDDVMRTKTDSSSVYLGSHHNRISDSYLKMVDGVLTLNAGTARSEASYFMLENVANDILAPVLTSSELKQLVHLEEFNGVTLDGS